MREALLANGPNLEWQIDAKQAKANYTNGFEWVEGKLMPENKGVWQVNIYGSAATDLSLNGDELVQAAGESDPQQSFVRSPINLTSDAPLGTNFEHALKTAYLGVSGVWSAVKGKAIKGTFLPMAGLPAYLKPMLTPCAWRATAHQ